jgi:hypothetical protein
VLVRALCTVKLTGAGRICAELAAPVSLPESDTIEVTELWRGDRRVLSRVVTGVLTDQPDRLRLRARVVAARRRAVILPNEEGVHETRISSEDACLSGRGPRRSSLFMLCCPGPSLAGRLLTVP